MNEEDNKTQSPLLVGSVCSGIEAASMAFMPLGMQFVFYSEIEKFPSEVLKQRHPEVPNLGDMTKFKNWPEKCGCPRAEFTGQNKTITIDGIKLKIYVCKKCEGIRIDVLIGGTPCQSFSVAGLRKGLLDPRGNLALTFLAIVERYQPTWVVWENVPGVHSSWSDVAAHPAAETNLDALRAAIEACRNAGLDPGTEYGAGEFEEVDQSSDFDCFLAGLEELRYGTATRIFDAQYFGVAQRRERVFVIGHLGGQWQRAAAVLFERESLRGDPAPRRETGKGTTHGISPYLEASGRGFERTGETRGQDPVIAEVCGTITKNYATHHGRTAGANGGVVPGQLIPIDMQQAIKNGKVSGNGMGIGKPGDPAYTVNASNHHAVAIAFAQNTRDEVREIKGNISGALGSEPGMKQQTYVAIPLQEVSKRTGKSTDDKRFGIGIGKDGDAMYTLQAGSEHGVAVPIGIDGGETGFARSANPSHSGDKGDGGVNTTLVVELAGTLRSHLRNNSNPGTEAQMLVAHTLLSFSSTEAGHSARAGDQGTPLIPLKMAVRRLTPRECERLQGFPDDYTLIIIRGKPAADGPRYKALGNSMAVPNIAWIGKRILLIHGMEVA